jgi:hypothetical protein
MGASISSIKAHPSLLALNLALDVVEAHDLLYEDTMILSLVGDRDVIISIRKGSVWYVARKAVT